MSCLSTTNGFSYLTSSPLRYASITYEDFLASAIASIAIEILSLPQSPPANTPGMLVINVSGSYAIAFFLVLSRPSNIPASTACPIARIIVSISRYSNLPSTGTGLLLPDASGSPSSITCSLTCLTWPFSSVITSAGFVRFLNITPSSSASTISTISAGISSLVPL